jgi:hypothetical protein
MENTKSWIKLNPKPIIMPTPDQFEPTTLNSKPIEFHELDAAHTGMYTPKQMSAFWNKIVFGQASKTALRRITENIVTLQTTGKTGNNGKSAWFTPNGPYFDSMLSPGYFVHQFIQTFGIFAFIVQQCGIYFASYLFIRTLIRCILYAVRAFEINQITG